MKRLTLPFFTCAILFCLTAHSQQTAKNNKQKSDMGMSDQLYKANYSSDFTMGNPEDVKLVLALYKDYENQDWSKDTWFADTVMVIFPDGTMLQGREPVISAFKQQRAGFSN